MRRRFLPLLVATVAWALAAGSAQAAPGLLVGAAEDSVKQPDAVAAKAKMDLARIAGLNALRVTSIWVPGKELDDGELLGLRNAALAAQLTGVRLFISVYPRNGKITPLTPAAREAFVSYAASLARELPFVTDFIIGNEPNLNTFWMPQFTSRGKDAAAPSYTGLLAQTYDALKAVNPAINVIGGALAPRGHDRPSSKRPTHSPRTFIRHMGEVFRRSGRTRPIMDMFAFHPYLEYSRIPPTLEHPITPRVLALADYAILVRLLGEAFDGTAQPGRKLPVLYDEFGVQSQIGPEKSRHYTNHGAAAARDAVTETRQANYYRKALELAYCQPTVIGLFFFHVEDESDLGAWQSGLYYADATPKSSLEPVRRAAEAARSGTLITCRREEERPPRDR